MADITVSANVHSFLQAADAAAANTVLGLGTGDTPEFTGLGIGTSSPGAGLHAVTTNGLIRISHTEADASSKFARIVGTHYTTAEEPMALVLSVSDATTNQLRLGGGSSIVNAATSIDFYTAANATTTLGTKRMTVDSSGNVGIGTTSPAARLEVNQSSATGAVPCLDLDQDDVDQPFINFAGTASANATDSISTLTTSGATTHHVQIEINGVKAWIAASTTNPS